ncbi:MAG: SH3 domain-containing C40 family peptidase [Bacteroidota bacterium]
MFIKNKLFYLFILSFFVSCTIQNSDSSLSGINNDIDSLKNIYAPDTRIALWNILIEDNENKVTITAEVDNEKAKADLLKTLSSKYPDIDLTVNLLPEKKTNSMALVNNSVCNIRDEACHSAELVNQVLLGKPVKLLKKEDGWYLIQTPNQYIGWVKSSEIVRFDSTSLKEYKTTKKIIFNKQYGFSYTLPDSKSQIVTDLVVGCILPVIGNKKKFYKVKYPDNRVAFVKKDEVVDIDLFINKKPEENGLVNTAKKFIGIPYLWGGSSSKSIDCSGFTSNIYFLNGIIIQRDASQQVKYGKEITTSYDYTDLLPGDLLFIGRRANDSLPEKVTHVIMYIGDSEFIHASSTFGNVKINSMDSTRANYFPGYVSSFIKTIRIIGEENGSTIEKITNNKFYKTIISE